MKKENEGFRNKFLAVILSFLMVFGTLQPAFVMETRAVEPQSEESLSVTGLTKMVQDQENQETGAEAITVTLSAQAENMYLLPRQSFEVPAGLAGQYGYEYSDKVSQGQVTTLDALVAEHQLLFGEDFTTETAGEYLTVEGGTIKKLFGEETSACGFTVNGYPPNDGNYEGSNYGATGYLVNEAVLSEGDQVEFMLYQDTSMYMDYYTWFTQADEKTEAVSAKAGEEFTLGIQGYMLAYGGFYEPGSAGQCITDMEGAQIVTLDENGAASPVEGAVTDENGKVTLSFDQAGTYFLSAVGTVDSQEMFLPWCAVTVSEGDTQEPDTPQGKITLRTTLTDGLIQKGSRKTFDVWARDENDQKRECKAYFDGEEIGYNWNDDVKSSFTLDFSDKEDGDYEVRIEAVDDDGVTTSVTYTIHYQKAVEGECIGYAVFSLEAFTISKGYIIEPFLLPIYEGDNAAKALTKTLIEYGYGYNCTGNVESGFYLSQIYGSNYANNKMGATTQLDLSGAKLAEDIAEKIPSIAESFDQDGGTVGALGEFDYNYMSGWMYCVNGIFPNVGFADYYLAPSDVMRAQFTVGYGSEIGGSSGMGGGMEDAYAVADKDQLTTLLAKINSANNSESLKARLEDLMTEAKDTLQWITADQDTVDAVTEKLEKEMNRGADQITGIRLDQEQVEIPMDDTVVLEPICTPADPEALLLYDWSTSDHHVAFVENGKVTAVGAGTAVITASYGEFSASCTVTVPENPVESIRISVSQDTILKGKTADLSVAITPANTTEDRTVTWNSSDETVATVSSLGTVTGVKEGTVQITAAVGTHMDTCTITVQEVAMSGISLDQEAITLNKGKNQVLKLSCQPENTTDDKTAEWTSSDESVATVNTSGRVRGEKEGTAVITAKVGSFEASCTVTVKEIPLEQLVMRKKTAAVKTGRNLTLYMDAYPGDQTDGKDYKWTSSNEEIATVNKNGMVSGKAEGLVTITAESELRGAKDTCLVRVTAENPVTASSITFSEKEISLEKGAQKELTVDIKPATATEPVVFESSDEAIATVDENGKVTAIGRGTAVITAYAGSRKDICTVTVTVPNVFWNPTVAPADAIVFLKDSEGKRVTKTDGGYELTDGTSYTYTVSKTGYVAQTGELTAEGEMPEQITLAKAPESTLEILPSEWPGFRNLPTNMGITDAKTPITSESAMLLWANKIGTGWGGNAVSAPILVDGYLICSQGTRLLKCDTKTGEIVAEGTMANSSPYSIIPPTYAEGMIFVGLSGGIIQAFDASSLKSLWIYKDALGGQPNTPIKYSDGYVYAGFWNSETKPANMVCLSVTDENPNEETEAKNATWTDTVQGGFYWAGAYVTGNYVIVGTDDGMGGNTSPTANLYSYNKRTGEVADKITGFIGDIRSDVAYDQTTDRIYFTSKGGYLYSLKVNADGTFARGTQTSLDLGGMSTSTPVVYRGRAYVGVSGPSQFGGSGYTLKVINIAENGEMTVAYAADAPGYPQTSGILSNGYEKEDGSVYVYFTYNSKPGGIQMLKDKPGQTEADSQQVFTPTGTMAQFCICSLIADSNGTLYYKNDSGYMMAVTANEAYLTGMNAEGGHPVLDKGESFQGQEASHEITVDPGTEEVTIQVTALEGARIVMNSRKGDEGTFALEDGKAEITILVKKGTAKRTYTVSVRERKQDASLESLKVTGTNSYTSGEVALAPGFDSGTADYTADYDGKKTFLNIWPDAADGDAQVKVYPVSKVGTNTDLNEDGSLEITSSSAGHDRYAVYFAENHDQARVKVVVTAEDGVTVRTYTVKISQTAGNQPEIWVDEDPLAERSETQAVVRFYTSEGGTLYYAVTDANAQAPESIDTSGEGIAATDFDNEVTFTGLGSQAQDLYLVIKAEDGTLGQMQKISLPSQEAYNQKLLLEIKTEAREELASYKDLSQYRKEQQAVLEKAILDGQTAIDGAASQEAVEEAVRAAKTAMDAVKTDEELKEEEAQAAKALEEARETAKQAAKEYKNSEDYRETEQEKLQEILLQTQEKLQAADTIAKVEEILESAKASMDELMTDAQWNAKELNVIRTAAMLELEQYKKAADYRTEEQAKIRDILATARIAVYASSQEETVQSIVLLAKTSLDGLKTDQQYRAEETKPDVVPQPEKKPEVQSVVLQTGKKAMKKGQTFQLKASFSPAQAESKLTFSSSRKSVASVDQNGKVTARKAGKTVITVTTANGKKAQCTITVKKVKAKKITLNIRKKTLKKGKSFQLKARLTPKTSTDNIRWRSSNKKVVSVSSKGKITARKKGKAVITARTGSGKKITCTITVK